MTGFFARLRRATGIGLGGPELYSVGLKHAIDGQYSLAQTAFLKAADIYKATGDTTGYRSANANYHLCDVIPAIGQMATLDPVRLFPGLENPTVPVELVRHTIEQVDLAIDHLRNIQTIECPWIEATSLLASRLMSELAAVSALLGIAQSPSAEMSYDLYISAQNLFGELGSEQMSMYPAPASLYATLCEANARLLKSRRARWSDPVQASTVLDEAISYFYSVAPEAKVARDSARSSPDRSSLIGGLPPLEYESICLRETASCWICKRTVTGRGTHYQLYRPQIRSTLGLSPAEPMTHDADLLDRNDLALCIVCKSLLVEITSPARVTHEELLGEANRHASDAIAEALAPVESTVRSLISRHNLVVEDVIDIKRLLEGLRPHGRSFFGG